ncbi:MAG: DUF1772 domain-containing protein [Acidiferrobacterales bacterium]|nr:DUF1772 domain-containing protein [Acidiferrobacterales bacterium]
MIDLFATFTTLSLGLFAGSLLTEAMILVPYWRKMKHTDFLNLHSSLGPSLFNYFAPLTTTAVLLSVLLAGVTNGENTAWSLSALLCCTTLAIFFMYFRTANNRFATQAMEEDLRNELTSWANWHWVRTTLVIIALGSSIYGHGS